MRIREDYLRMCAPPIITLLFFLPHCHIEPQSKSPPPLTEQESATELATDHADPCSHLTCDTPPKSSCSENTAITYEPMGACIDGACIYHVRDKSDCNDGDKLCCQGLCQTPRAHNNIWFTEIHYNPSMMEGADGDLEFVELYNAGPGAIALDNYRISAGINHTFSSARLCPNSHLVVAKNELSYSNQGFPVEQWSSGYLSNQGETLALENSEGTIIDEVAYDDWGLWPKAADGTGLSLELISPHVDNSDPAQWRTSLQASGSPGTARGDAPNTMHYQPQDLRSGAQLVSYVATTGIVTSFFDEQFTIQNGTGPQSGLWVHGRGVVVGDEVLVEGMLVEYEGLLIVVAEHIAIQSSGHNLPEPLLLRTGTLTDPRGADNYQGVLVSATGLCDNIALPYGEWSIDDGTGSLVVDDLGYSIHPATGVAYTIVGPLYYSYGKYKVAPFDELGIVLTHPCEAQICNAPPASTCNGNLLTTYAPEGICMDSECSYDEHTIDCGPDYVCRNGACLSNQS